MRTKQQQLEDSKTGRRKNLSFAYLKPTKNNGVWEIELNGRLYRNMDKKLLIKDIETIENG